MNPHTRSRAGLTGTSLRTAGTIEGVCLPLLVCST